MTPDLARTPRELVFLPSVTPRARGLARRMEDLVVDGQTAELLDAALKAARRLPAPEWRQRLSDGAPRGAAEKFLGLARAQVLARGDGRGGGYSREPEPGPALAGRADAAGAPRRVADRPS